MNEVPASAASRSAGVRRWGLAILLAVLGGVIVFELGPLLPSDTSLSGVLAGEIGRELETVSARFGTDDLMMIVVRDEGAEPLFNPRCRALMQEIDAVLLRSGIVETVVSLETLEEVRVRRVLGVAVPGLPERLLGEQVSPQDRARLLADPFLARGMISADGRRAVTYALLDRHLRRQPAYLGRVRDLVSALPKGGGELSMSVTGLPVIQEAVMARMAWDGIVLTLLALGLVGLVAWAGGVGLGSILGFALGWPVVAGVLVLWFRGMGRNLHGFLPSLLPLLVITSGSTLIHLGLAPRSREGWWEVLRACFLSTVATGVGFSCLGFSPVPAIAALGIEAVVGTFVAFAVTAFAAAWVGRRVAPRRVAALATPLHPSKLFVRIAIPLLVISALPWWLSDPARLSRQSALANALPPDHPVVAATDELESAAGALTTVDVVLTWDDAESPAAPILDPGFYLRLRDLEAALVAAADGDLGFVLGPAALIAHLNTRLADANPNERQASFEVTEEAAAFAIRWLIRPYLAFFGEGSRHADPQATPLGTLRDRMRPFLAADGRALRLMGRVQALPPDRMLELRTIWERDVFPRFDGSLGGARLRVTGHAMAIAETTVSVRDAQLRALGAGGLMLAVLLVLVLRSWRAGLAGIAASLGALGSAVTVVWSCNLDLSLYSTVLFATVIGVLADDAIHLLLACRTRGGNVSAAVEAAGPRIVLTSLGLAVGFLAFAFSGLAAYRGLAVAGVAAVTFALGWDLLVLPHLVRLLARR